MEPNIGINQMSMVAGQLSILLQRQFSLFHLARLAHWNVTGPNFSELHEILFKKAYELFEATLDDTAERIRQLGGMVYPLILDEAQFNPSVERILESIETCIRFMRSDVYPTISEVGDYGGQTLIGQQMADYEKLAWQLRSTIE